jgi:small subunit ribosomal protein S31
MPNEGPLGLFFESACNGLSQNPFISVDEKLEHLEWFRQYFNKYEKDLLNLDAVQPGQLVNGKFENKIIF